MPSIALSSIINSVKRFSRTLMFYLVLFVVDLNVLVNCGHSPVGVNNVMIEINNPFVMFGNGKEMAASLTQILAIANHSSPDEFPCSVTHQIN